MSFSPRKPSHLLALALLIFTIFTIYVPPFLASTETEEVAEKLTEGSILLNSLLLTIFLIGMPLVWLVIVDGKKPTDALYFIRLKRKNIKTALAFGLIAFVGLFVLLIFVSLVIYVSGVRADNPVGKSIISNVSLATMIVMFTTQSAGEEVFFRGFIMKKLEQRVEIWAAITMAAILFGIAHIGYGNTPQIIITLIIGIALGYIVVKTDNLVSSITAHILFNIFIYCIASIALNRSTLTL